MRVSSALYIPKQARELTTRQAEAAQDRACTDYQTLISAVRGGGLRKDSEGGGCWWLQKQHYHHQKLQR